MLKRLSELAYYQGLGETFELLCHKYFFVIAALVLLKLLLQLHDTDSDINNLIFSCPRLCTLRLKYFEGTKCLNIQAQYLSKGCLLTKLPGVFDNLEKICIVGHMWNWEENNACAEDSWPEDMCDEDYTKIQAPTLDHLVMVTLHDFMDFDYEIALLGLLLNWAQAARRTENRCP
ncbi:hypothetical protein BAE44_0023089 [Dichanthelium oligosanthes]|uniref:FBD domain-containing protein n=1 Tax=Dichanthelium oligosanthes TaxID=888268 RepID=A0A1E5USK6_9POAL|nr:hypothetical protein BAE44_0023089 [Dichanthelium oligosanthes]